MKRLCLALIAVWLPAVAAPLQPPWRSAFDGYQPFADAPVRSWVEANETVRQVGGWRAYAREAQAAQPAKAASGATAPHAGDEKK